VATYLAQARLTCVRLG